MPREVAMAPPCALSTVGIISKVSWLPAVKVMATKNFPVNARITRGREDSDPATDSP